MNAITRRSLLRSTALIPVAALALSTEGCAGLTSLPQFASDAQSIAGALVAALPTIQKVTGIAASTIDTVTGLVTEAQTVAGSIVSAASAGASGIGALVSNFGSIVSGIVSATGVSIPGTWGVVLQAATSLIPGILSAAGVVLAAAPGAPSPTMAPSAARAILEAVAKQ